MMRHLISYLREQFHRLYDVERKTNSNRSRQRVRQFCFFFSSRFHLLESYDLGEYLLEMKNFCDENKSNE